MIAAADPCPNEGDQDVLVSSTRTEAELAITADPITSFRSRVGRPITSARSGAERPSP